MTCGRRQIRLLRLPWGRRPSGGHEARFVSFVCLGGGGHEARFVSFVWRPHEGDSCCFTTGVAQGGGGRGSRFIRLHRTSAASIASRAAGTKSDSSPSYGRHGGHTKEIRAASRPEWLRAAVGEEADSSPSPHECGQLRQPSGQARSQIRIIRMVATRSKVVLLRLQQITSGEAPSWSFGEASPNDREGASVAFTGGTWCASDHMKQIHVPSCAQFRHG